MDASKVGSQQDLKTSPCQVLCFSPGYLGRTSLNNPPMFDRTGPPDHLSQKVKGPRVGAQGQARLLCESSALLNKF